IIVISQNNFLYIGGYHLQPGNSIQSMVKLTQKKINWIIKQKENRMSSSEIARIMSITTRYVKMIYRKYSLEIGGINKCRKNERSDF
ncbi:MAG: hypothetical protein ACP5G5_07825, partial [Thermoplasmata archaeon]